MSGEGLTEKLASEQGGGTEVNASALVGTAFHAEGMANALELCTSVAGERGWSQRWE